MTQGDFHNILASYTQRSNWGLRIDPKSGNTAIHKGIDLAAAEGAAIKLPYTGTVVNRGSEPDKSKGRGNWIIIKHVLSDGTFVYTEYMHMLDDPRLDPKLQPGLQISKDYEIGKVGSTGKSTGPHLHYQEMLLVNGRYVPVDPNLNWFGLSAGPAATPDAGTGKNIPGQSPDPAAKYRKAYGTDGTVWLLYETGETFSYSMDMQQWSIPAADGGFTTISRNVYAAGTPQASFSEWSTTEVRPDGTSYSPLARFLALEAMNVGNPFLDPATAQDYALATATGSNLSLTDQAVTAALNTQTFTLYASGASSLDQTIELTLQGDSANKFVCTAGSVIPFDGSGKATVTIPAGQDRLVIDLLDGSAISGTETLSLMAVLIDPNAVAGSPPVSSNTFNVTFNIPPETQYTPITGDVSPVDTDPAEFGIQAAGNSYGNPLGMGMPYEDILWDSSGNDHIQSGELTDLVMAGTGDDWIEGGNGNDVLLDSLGNDLIEGGAGKDLIYAGDGNDRLYGNVKIDTATAITNGSNDTGSGNKGDWLAGQSGDDTLTTGADDDVLSGGGGNDTIIAGAGNDLIFGDSNVRAVYSMPGGTPRYSVGGVDYYSVSQASFNWGYTYTNGVLDYTTQVASEPDPADAGNDIIYAGNGDDLIWAGGHLQRFRREAANDAEGRMVA